MPFNSRALTVDPSGRVIAGGTDGIYAISPDLSLRQITKDRLGCFDVVVGQDGGIWDMAEPYTRWDPLTGAATHYASPDGSSGCPPPFAVDRQARVWSPFFGVQRLDLVNQKVDTLFKDQNVGGQVVLDGNQAWVFNGAKAYAIDQDTLKVNAYLIAGFQSNGGFYFVHGGMIWVYDYVLGKLLHFDPTSGVTEQYTLPKSYSISSMLGIDGQGRLWLDTSSRWVLLDPTLNTVVADHPRLGRNAAVAPDGGLWFWADDGGFSHINP